MLRTNQMENGQSEQTLEEKRELRFNYRQIIQETEVEKQVLLQSNISTLAEKIDKGNALFGSVKSTQEALVSKL